MRAVFLDSETLDRGDLDLAPLEAAFETLAYHPRTAPAQVVERLAGAPVAIVNKVPLDGDALRALPELRLICVTATGVNNVDLEACRACGVRVMNCRGYGTDSVAQHAIGMMILLSTRMLDYTRAVENGDWSRSTQFCLLDFPIRELAGRTLGIVGYGTLGQRVAALAEAFGMEVRVAQRPGGEPTPDRLPLEALLPQLDVLSLHCPLTEATHHLIDAEALAAMRPGALLINTARGALVEDTALVEALRSGHLGGAGLDVLEPEPPPVDHPLLAPDLPNLLVTPHSAWGSREARQRIVTQLVENVAAFRAGREGRAVA